MRLTTVQMELARHAIWESAERQIGDIFRMFATDLIDASEFVVKVGGILSHYGSAISIINGDHPGGKTNDVPALQKDNAGM